MRFSDNHDGIPPIRYADDPRPESVPDDPPMLAIEGAMRAEADDWARRCAAWLAAGYDGPAATAARRYRYLVDSANALRDSRNEASR